MMGLPSLNALDQASRVRIWLCARAADMRWSFDRLAALAQSVTSQNPLDGHLFVFRSRSGDKLKILYFDRDGYALWYKRLEQGVFRLPRPGPAAASLELRASELAMLLEGIDLSSLRRGQRFVLGKQ